MDTLDLERALTAMAAAGDIEPLLAQLREQVVARLGNKDLRQFNEKVLKRMLLAYISRSRTFRILSEKEFSGGSCDLLRGLNADVSGTRYAWMLEVKCLRTEAIEGGPGEVTVHDAVSELHFGRLLKGENVPVRVDPMDRTRVAVVWDQR